MQLKIAKSKSNYNWKNQSTNNNNTISFVIQFVLFCLIQVLVLDEIVLFNYLAPIFYFAFIILLPIRINNLLLLLISFLMGLSVDVFHATLGLNASACVTLAFAKTVVVNFMSPDKQVEKDFEPTINQMGFMPFLSYVAILAFVFNLFYQFTELFSFSDFGSTLIKVLASTAVSACLILIYHLIFGRK